MSAVAKRVVGKSNVEQVAAAVVVAVEPGTVAEVAPSIAAVGIAVEEPLVVEPWNSPVAL